VAVEQDDDEEDEAEEAGAPRWVVGVGVAA